MSRGDGKAARGAKGASRTILRAEGVRKRYRMGSETLEILKGVDLSVRSNEIVAIVGPSGAGKSTLLHILGLLDPPTEGSVYLEDVDAFALPPSVRARHRNLSLGFVFQFYHLLPDLDAVENTALPAMVRDSVFAYDRRAARKRARALLERVGLAKRLRHRPSELSGGERQRVAIARALMNEPKVLLCDEPTGNLDLHTAEGILELLWQLKAESETTFVIVTHSEDLAKDADRTVRLDDGRAVNAR